MSDRRAMGWVVLWFGALLVGTRCLSQEQATLGKGQACGGTVVGQCDTNLTCVTAERSKEGPPGAGVCSLPLAPGCVPCSGVQCPRPRRVCPGGHVTEPCGCCPQCARQRGQACGGPHWSRGYCDRDLTCTLLRGLGPATPPQTGVCKVLPGQQADPLADPLCPWTWGCNVRAGACDCYPLQTCHSAFSYTSLEACLKAMRGDEQYWSDVKEEEEEEERDCVEWGCEVQADQCVCVERSCVSSPPLLSEEACQDLLEKPRYFVDIAPKWLPWQPLKIIDL